MKSTSPSRREFVKQSALLTGSLLAMPLASNASLFNSSVDDTIKIGVQSVSGKDAVFNLIVTLELFLLTRSFWSFAVAGVLHVIGYLGCLRDPRFFDIWGVKLRHCPRVKNHWFWRMNSYRP